MRTLESSIRVASMCLVAALAACGGSQPKQSTSQSTRAKPVEQKPVEEPQTASDPKAPIIVANVGLQTPDSVIHDPEADVYLVSNINGSPFGQDHAGFISRVRPDGTVENLKWIDGSAEKVTLDAPRGMVLIGPTLYVADLKVVRMFDRQSGAPKGEIPIPGATFITALAVAPDQTLYVLDMALGPNSFKPTRMDAVYRIAPNSKKVGVLVKDPRLSQPNALVATSDAVFVVDWEKGNLRRVDRKGVMSVVTTLPANQLDGIVQDKDGAFLISSWGGLAVYRVTPDGQVTKALVDLTAPSGLGYDSKRHRVLVPFFQDHKLVIHPL